ncbi:MAG TPA: O-antigen ligase family protein [Thermoleophilaceae bacterium]|nr:O-antigen ligase family protein [Thermoleophilaceae bacterium]
MDAPLAVATSVKEIGVVSASAAAALGLLLPKPAQRAVAMLVAITLVPVLVIGEVWDSPQFQPVRDHVPLAIAGALAGAALIALLARLFLKRPNALPLLAVAALPFRIPLNVGGGSANLLVPLYVVVAAGVVAYAWERLRPDPFAGSGGTPRIAPRDRRGGDVELALLIAVVVYAIQAAWSSDFETALKNVAFFYVPFLLLFRLLAATNWTRRLAINCLVLATALALTFVAIGFVEYATRHLLWNPKVIASNQFESYFRVNSLFFDPNIYGRFLAVVMSLLAALELWARQWKTMIAATLALGVLLAGLVLTFSQSSLAALLVSCVVLAALRWPAKPVLLGAAGLAFAALVVTIAFPGVTKVDLGSGRSLKKATSGRTDLIKGGVRMFLDRPVLGYGSGAFAEQFRQREKTSDERAASASHTIPITIAAEQGIVGLATYVFVLFTAFSLVWQGLGRLRGPEPPPAELVARGAIAAAFTGLVVHTLAYAAFLEDPLTWTLLGAALGLRFSAGQPASARAAAAEGTDTAAERAARRAALR